MSIYVVRVMTLGSSCYSISTLLFFYINKKKEYLSKKDEALPAVLFLSFYFILLFLFYFLYIHIYIYIYFLILLVSVLLLLTG